MADQHTECPTCGSPDPAKHPAVQYGGEVSPCSDPFHAPVIEVSMVSQAEDAATFHRTADEVAYGSLHEHATLMTEDAYAAQRGEVEPSVTVMSVTSLSPEEAKAQGYNTTASFAGGGIIPSMAAMKLSMSEEDQAKLAASMKIMPGRGGVIMLPHTTSFPAARSMMRRLVDVVWGFANEDVSVPSTRTSDMLIDRVLTGQDALPAQQIDVSWEDWLTSVYELPPVRDRPEGVDGPSWTSGHSYGWSAAISAVLERLFASPPVQPVAVGWVIADAEGARFRFMVNGEVQWTHSLNRALHFSTREDAEQFCADDDLAWKVLEARRDTLTGKWELV